jgi:cytochrome oxidase assembly protein ShyY1
VSASETSTAAESAPSGVRRWGAYLALVIVFAIACGLLSWWQWARRAETIAQGNLVTENYETTPVAVGQLLPSLGSWTSGEEWRPVEMRGHYLRDEQVLARNRPYNANPGFEVLVPFQVDDGTVFIVDRGWLSIGTKQDAPDVIPAAPAGEVTVVARLQQSEPVLPGRTAPRGQVASINLPTIAKLAGTSAHTYTGAYGLLDTESPPTATRPRAVQEPITRFNGSPSACWRSSASFGRSVGSGGSWRCRPRSKRRHVPRGFGARIRTSRTPSWTRQASAESQDWAGAAARYEMLMRSE